MRNWRLIHTDRVLCLSIKLTIILCKLNIKRAILRRNSRDMCNTRYASITGVSNTPYQFQGSDFLGLKFMTILRRLPNRHHRRAMYSHKQKSKIFNGLLWNTDLPEDVNLRKKDIYELKLKDTPGFSGLSHRLDFEIRTLARARARVCMWILIFTRACLWVLEGGDKNADIPPRCL